MTFSEAHDLGMFGIPPDTIWNFADQFAEAGIVTEHSPPEDVLDLSQDMFDKLDGMNPPAGAAELQEMFAKR